MASPKTPPKSPKADKAVSKYIILYASAAAILLVVVIMTLVPLLSHRASFVFGEQTLSIFYAIISLAIAMILFGVINDSGALIRLSKARGSFVQISGSAAGFAIFYYLLSSGLNPYTYVDFYIYNDNEQIARSEDGRFLISVLSHVKQSKEITYGFTTFPVPRDETSIRVDIASMDGRTWALDRIEPNHCVSRNKGLSLACDEFYLFLKKEQGCISDLIVSSYEEEQIETTLEIIIDTFKENLQRATPDIPVNVVYTNSVLESGVLDEKFQIERKNETARPVCDHLSSIENRFNISMGKEVIKTYLSCNKIFVALASDDIKAGPEQCL